MLKTLVIIASLALVARAADTAPNVLTSQETKAGWKLLWDGKTTNGWRSARSTTFPDHGWTIKDGTLSVVDSGGHEGSGGGDIVTLDKYSNFELVVDFKITPGANSGIKYFVDPELNKNAAGSSIGYEYQVLDDERHPDAKLGKNGNRTLGSLYDLLPASKSKKVNPIGEWNTARIVVRGIHVEHWLNGEKILDYTRPSPEFQAAFAESKFKKLEHFPTVKEGYILLQDHGNAVSFRNIKIRVLPNA
ncbi:MAG TPA: DUF1080 domain-containing protein [Opitutaceae bacterium]|nr:DUF1080 domain-containing protein [Opitutaceae bacterium]